MRKLKLVPGVAVVLALFTCTTASPVLALGEATGSTGSVTITRHANMAAKAFALRDYKKARDEYRIAIGLAPDNLEFYYGLYDVCIHSGEWDQVCFALEKIFEVDPSKKKQLGAEYGECLYNLRRYDEAIPVLKQALKDADLPLPKIALVVPEPAPEPEAPPTKAPPATTATTPATTVATATPSTAVAVTPTIVRDVNEGVLGDYSRSIENACRSEFIGICEYQGFDDTHDITYYHPPRAHYHIEKILKGPPLNAHIPIRYEFHDRSKGPAPKDWKFDKDKMPTKGSKWLVFIQNAVPRDGEFDTYQGSYGRQPATEEILNQVYAKLEKATNRD
jgi:tetratricopeptide (TPR) repeat protein